MPSPKHESFVLILEDDPNDAFLIQRAIRKVTHSCRYHVLSKGHEVISYLRGDGDYARRDEFPLPDLVLRDVALAEVPGLDLLQSVRGLFDCGRLPVIPWSSTDHAEDVDRAYELGANSFVVKPVDFGGLQNILGRLLSFWGGRVQVPGCSRAPRSIAETC